MKRSLLVIFFITLSVAYSRVGMKEDALVVDRDFGPIVYAEDFYRLYRLPMYYHKDDLIQNIVYLDKALNAPFDFVHRAICIIETKEEYRKYKDLLHMQFYYLITQNYIYLAAEYDKQHYYWYNDQFKKEIAEGFDIAEEYYQHAQTYWALTKEKARAVRRNKAYIELDVLLDKAYAIDVGEVDYAKTAARAIAQINKKRALMEEYANE